MHHRSQIPESPNNFLLDVICTGNSRAGIFIMTWVGVGVKVGMECVGVDEGRGGRIGSLVFCSSLPMPSAKRGDTDSSSRLCHQLPRSGYDNFNKT